jgi:hypothetical protein
MPLSKESIESLVAALRRKDAAATVFGIQTAERWEGERKSQMAGLAVRVEEARSALELREVLLQSRAPGEALVILTNLSECEFGRENMSRIANRRLESVQPWPLVRLRFGATSVDPALVQHEWLAKWILEQPGAVVPLPTGMLDAETAWGLVLRSLGLSGMRPGDEEFLSAAESASFAQALRALPSQGQAAVRKLIGDALGQFGLITLAVVERGYSDQLLAAGLVAQCIHAQDGSDFLTVRGAFVERFGARGLVATVAERWGAAVSRLLRQRGSQVARVVRDCADRILEHDLHGVTCAHASDELPSSFNQRIASVGLVVEQAVQSADPAASVEPLLVAVQQLRRHVLKDGDPISVQRAENALRLVRWLANLGEMPQSGEAALRWYSDQGCWVDRARLGLWRAEAVPSALRAYQALAARVSAKRDLWNDALAPLVVNANVPGPRLLGVEHVLPEVVAPLARDCSNGVALIVMDGMSHAVALALLEAFERRGWVRHRQRDRPSPPLVLSVLPSVTEHSRASLLSGRLITGKQDTERSGFEAFLKAGSLKGELFHKDALTADPQSVHEAIASSKKVVACVVNAVDDQLAGSAQLQVSWDLDGVPALLGIVKACEMAGRAIVLASDHGHVVDEATAQRPMDPTEDAREGARWRSVDGDAQSGEIKVSGPRVLAAGGSCILAVSESVRYTGRRAGYHGGLSMQEVACPLHVLMPASDTGDDQAASWIPLEPSLPDWWQDSAWRPAAMLADPPQVVSRPRKTLSAKVEAPGLFSRGTAAWIDRLLESEILQNQRKIYGRNPPSDDEIRQLLEIFVKQTEPGNGRIKITEQALAARLERSIGATRNLAARAQRVLNVDGYDVLAKSDQTTFELDVNLLKDQFHIGGAGS